MLCFSHRNNLNIYIAKGCNKEVTNLSHDIYFKQIVVQTIAKTLAQTLFNNY